MKPPEEDPKDKRERERQRRMSVLERRQSAQKNASDMTNDIARVHGLGGLRNLGATGAMGVTPVSPFSKLQGYTQ